ncbi:MAG: gliding motility-associated C-terminal domain-containing protein [Sediminibacterium sp.]
MKQLFLAISVFFIVVQAIAQPCASVANNVICADAPAATDQLSSNPFGTGCFSYSMTNFYSFHTGSTPNGILEAGLTFQDCDDFAGNNTIGLVVAELIPSSDPCSPASYNIISPCFSSDSSTVFYMGGLLPEHDYVILVGTDHDPLFGICSYDLQIAGTSVDIVAGTYPFEIVLGESTSAMAQGGGSNTVYTWDPMPEFHEITSDSTMTFFPTEEGQTISISAVGTIGDCSVNAPVFVRILSPLSIYNALTPNGDNIDDTWTIGGIDRPVFEAAVVSVFDRWGQQVFKSLGYRTPWDGTNNGKYLPTGAYYYVIELNTYNLYIPPYVGIVSILR